MTAMKTGPVQISGKIHMIRHDEKATAVVDYDFKVGQPISQDYILEAIGKAIESVPKSFRLMDGSEFFNYVVVKEMTGRVGNFAVPQSFAWDPAELEASARAAAAAAKERDKASKPADTDRKSVV